MHSAPATHSRTTTNFRSSLSSRQRWTPTLFALALLASIAWTVMAVPAMADMRTSTAYYSGLDGNWFNAANWSTGRVPDLTPMSSWMAPTA